MALDQKYLYPFFGPVAVDLKPLNYLPWGARPKKTVQHNFGLAPFGPKIFGLKTFGAEKFGLAVPSQIVALINKSISDLSNMTRP